MIIVLTHAFLNNMRHEIRVKRNLSPRVPRAKPFADFKNISGVPDPDEME